MLRLLLGLSWRVFHSRCDLLLENLAPRQQLLTLKRQKPRPRLAALDRLFWVVAKRLWPKWRQALVIVTPETVVRWHRVGFRLYWKWISRSQAVLGRRRVSKELRELIFRMVVENPTWGAPRIHGELLTEVQIRDACQQYKFDVAVIGHSSRRKLKQEWMTVIRKLCPFAKVLEVHLPHEVYALHDADDWMESFSMPDQLADRVSALAGEKRRKPTKGK